MKIPTSKLKAKGQAISKLLKERLNKGEDSKEINLLSIAQKVAKRQIDNKGEENE